MIHPVFVVNCTKIRKGLPFPCTDLKKSNTKQPTNKILSKFKGLKLQILRRNLKNVDSMRKTLNSMMQLVCDFNLPSISKVGCLEFWSGQSFWVVELH